MALILYLSMKFIDYLLEVTAEMERVQLLPSTSTGSLTSKYEYRPAVHEYHAPRLESSNLPSRNVQTN
jgi:hypothetical protein